MAGTGKILLAFFVMLGVVGATQDPSLVFATEMMMKMTHKEKMEFIQGVKGNYTGNIPAVTRLGIPEVRMNDGPQGFRAMDRSGGEGTTTNFPSSLTVAATWDENLVLKWATAMAEEFKGKGANVQLGPGIGIARVDVAGRNFEYMSGEDPTLGAILVKNYVKGLQDNGVIATAKHWVNNEIEDHRMTVDANVNERVRRELYYPPFQASIEAGTLCVMCSYNRINGVYACANNETLGDLRDMGFHGFVVSDWTAVKSTDTSLKAGTDVEMPYGLFYSNIMLDKHLKDGSIAPKDIDTAVTRVLYSMHKVGLFDSEQTGSTTMNVTSDAHNQITRELAANAITLLKNDNNVLPLDKASLQGNCIAVFGDETTVAGGGSGHVNGAYIITPAQGIANALAGTNVEVLYSAGTDMTEVTNLASKCAAAVVVVAQFSEEGSDRESLSFGTDQDNLVTTVAGLNKKTIVFMNIPGAVLMPWVNSVPAVLANWYLGQEAGNAMADVLFGAVNPSARLPITMPNKQNEVGFTAEQYPGVGFPPEAYYTEELLIGYRWYDANNVKPVFAFGHGLSYTTFDYSNIHVVDLSKNMKDKKSIDALAPVAMIEFTVKNTGTRDGNEIPQLYLAYPSAAGEPPKQLRSFTKVAIKAGDSTKVTFILNKRDCSIWDSANDAWTIVSGTYNVLVGAASDDIRLQGSFTL